jgi:hypothetical protein
VNAANIRATKPEYIVNDDWQGGAWRWSLYDSESGARFADVHSPTVEGDPAVAQGGPEEWVHAKQAQLPSGERVQVKAIGFRWSDQVVQQMTDLHTKHFGEAPTCLSGDLEADNLGYFQQAYDQLRIEHEDWTPEQRANEAARATPFGRTREKFNHGNFDVTATDPKDVSFRGNELEQVPTRVRVEALPSGESAAGDPPEPSSAEPRGNP